MLNEKDRREYFIKLTPTAFQLMPEIYDAVSSVNEAALKGILAEQQKMLYKNIDQIKQNLESLPSETVHINYKKRVKKYEAENYCHYRRNYCCINTHKSSFS